jgi:hypothetical protein
MTTLTNHQVVAELYWTLKAIKEATGITPKCWRPPQGDVDDRIRAIAWQMGMHTVLWNEDTDDWALPAPGGGSLAPEKVDARIQKWIDEAGSRDSGLVVLQHELNSATINLTMTWLPTLQNIFNVVPAMACNGVTRPYWESDFVYPLTFEHGGNAAGIQSSNYEASSTGSNGGVSDTGSSNNVEQNEVYSNEPLESGNFDEY